MRDLETSFLNNRNQQLGEPLLAVAKAVSDEWYQRGIRAAQFFTTGKTDKDLTHMILLGAYRVFRSGNYLDRIHSMTFLQELDELGIPKWIDQNHLLEHLSGYDPEIATRQMKIGERCEQLGGFSRAEDGWNTNNHGGLTAIS
jgi:Protein of unknown function (DUF3631)